MSETLWSGRFLEIRRAGTWEFATRREDLRAVVMLATDGDGVLLVEQERPPVGGRTIELPAGLIGDAGEPETPTEAAARELEEECGYRAASIESLGAFASSPGLTSEMFEVVRMTGLTRIGDGGGVGAEAITVHLVPVAEVTAFVEHKRAEGCAIDAKLLILLGAGFLAR